MNGFCTIVTEDYLPAAFALADALKRLAPGASVSALVLADSLEGPGFEVPAALKGVLSLHSLRDLGGTPPAPALIRKYRKRLNALRWSLKPAYMSFLLNGPLEKAVYVDPDIMFFNEPGFLFDELDAPCGVLLTPHWRGASFKEDPGNFHKQFTEGIFNAGFLGASRLGLPALKWWAGLCLERCEKNPELGLYDDQGYLDIMHIYFDNVRVLRHRGCNIALWNRKACERSLDANGELLINKRWKPVFIHFSCLSDCSLPDCDPLIIPYLKRYQELLSAYHFKGQFIFFSKHEKARASLISLLADLASKGAKSAAIYGCGSFARGIFAEPFETAIPLDCFIDDNEAAHGSVFAGRPVVGLKDAFSRKPDAVLIASDSIGEALAAKASAFFPAERVLRFCEDIVRKPARSAKRGK